MSVAANAQNKVEVDLGADLVNQFIWRGLDSGHASIQPYLGLNWKGLSVSAWGSVGITNSDDAKELDLNVFYTAGPLTVGITDYWFDTPNPNYFAYKAMRSAPLNFVYSGYINYSSSGALGQGSDGIWWSTTAYSSSFRHGIKIAANTAFTDGQYRYNGASIRCIVK